MYSLLRGNIDSLIFGTIIPQFNTCGCLLTSRLLTFSALLAYSKNAALYLKTLFFLPLLSDISAIYSAIFIYFCQCISLYFQWYFHLIFSKLLFNYLVSKLFKLLLSCYCSIVKTELIYCSLFSFNRIAGVYCDWCTGTFMRILKTRSGAECEYMSMLSRYMP